MSGGIGALAGSYGKRNSATAIAADEERILVRSAACRDETCLLRENPSEMHGTRGLVRRAGGGRR